jgi:hypothetical protein
MCLPRENGGLLFSDKGDPIPAVAGNAYIFRLKFFRFQGRLTFTFGDNLSIFLTLTF